MIRVFLLDNLTSILTGISKDRGVVEAGGKASQLKSHYTIRKGTSCASLKGVKKNPGQWVIAQISEMFSHAHPNTVVEL